jgi:hypothetical protein
LVSNFNNFLVESSNSNYYKESLNASFWEKTGSDEKTEWVLDPLIRKKLLKIANEFIDSNSDILKKKDILDIQFVGSLAGYNWTQHSDIDLHIIVDFKDMGGDQKMIDYAMYGCKFVWNTNHDIVMRGHDVEIAIQDINAESHMSCIFSLEKNKWVKKPKYSNPKIDSFMVDKKFSEFSYEINKLENKLILSDTTPSNSESLYKRAIKLREKIMRMRKESLSEGGEFSTGNLVFKKLRSEGYIGRLIDLINKSYDKIYTVKN